jgi:ABC-type polysaccharide/polyol phosphate transport system ATPase subunit
MSSDIAIKVGDLSKCYQIYDRPKDRLKQMLLGSKRQYYREFWALKDVSFEIKKGETVGIVGRNGSGKSTLLQIICGTLNATSGTIQTNGRIAALLELGSGFNPEFSGRENIYLNGAIHGLSRQNIENKIDGILGFADIGDFIDQPVKTYSSGMYARLAFSASMFVDPAILIVDEILAVGDAPFQAKCMRAFHKLRDDGCAIIIVSHDSYMIKNFCQTALYLKRGSPNLFGQSAYIVDQYNVEIEKAVAGNSAVIEDVPQKTQHAIASETVSLFRITSVDLLNANAEKVNRVKTGDTVSLDFHYSTIVNHNNKITFVINLYRHDGLYVCGTTTLMDNLKPFASGTKGSVNISFPNIRLLAGQYVWRVAINDERAFGVYAEANQVCGFEIVDHLEAVGMFNLERAWTVSIEAEQ